MFEHSEIWIFLQATGYGKCVANKDDVKRNDCLQEFNALKECFTKTVSILIMSNLNIHSVQVKGITGVGLIYVHLLKT